jgi:KDO2-lipid IV(A) lauroyltransferase
MGDRDIEGPKEPMPFFGETTLMPTGPIEVALRTGVPVLPCFCVRKSKYVIEAWVEEPLQLRQTGDSYSDVYAGMMEYIQRLEARLRADPGQWAVIERIWDGAPKHEPAASLAGERPEVAAGERRDG